jgi:hypothetical protein
MFASGPRRSVVIARLRKVKQQVVDSLWLLRRSMDGGTDYVLFRGGDEPVEMLEGYHLPPQMPFIKRRKWLNRADAKSCQRRLERSEGYRHGAPLF